jgi:hypothetical protein
MGGYPLPVLGVIMLVFVSPVGIFPDRFIFMISGTSFLGLVRLLSTVDKSCDIYRKIKCRGDRPVAPTKIICIETKIRLWVAAG